MSKANHSTRQTLADHSAAKVSVFTNYLKIYLNILGKVPAMQRVHIYDLMCGEGEYADGRLGSALEGLKSVSAYFADYPAETLRVSYYLNDAGMSDIEKTRLKIDRVRERALEMPSDPKAALRLDIAFTGRDFADAFQRVFEQVQRLSFREKALIFIDPWGYKDIRTEDLRAALAGEHSEILLFLPTEMMYRFARKAYHEDFEGGAALQRWLTELFPEALPNFSNVHDFINQFRHRLQEQIGVRYSSRFTLETADHNTYSLFYFTPKRKGLKAMLEEQWKQDPKMGSGHRVAVEQNFTLFTPGELASYPARVEAFLAAATSRTNEELLEFGLAEDFLPKHTAEALKILISKNRLQMTSPDGQPIRKNAFYLDNPDRFIRFTLLT